MSKYIIISTKEPQYIYLSKILKKKRFNNYYFIETIGKSKINYILSNFKKSLRSKKIFQLLLYYFLKIFFLGKYSKKYKVLKKKFFAFYFNKIKNEKVKKFKYKKTFKRKILILFGSPYISKSFINNFETVYNIHLGLLPEYAGLKSFERMILNGKFMGFTLHDVTSEIDKGDILYKKKVLFDKRLNIIQNYIKLYEEIFKFLGKLISKKKKNNFKRFENSSKLFYGFEFNELKYKKLLRFNLKSNRYF